MMSVLSPTVRPPLRFETYRECWQKRWQEYLSPTSTALLFSVPFMMDFQKRLDERSKTDDPEAYILEDGKMALTTGLRVYCLSTVKMGIGITVATCILMQDGRKVRSAISQSIPRTMAYHWDYGPLLMAHYLVVLGKKLSLPGGIVTLLGRQLSPEHVHYFEMVSSQPASAAMTVWLRWWISFFSETAVEHAVLVKDFIKVRRSWHSLFTESVSSVVDKICRLLFHAAMAIVGGQINPGWGAFWFDFIAALLAGAIVTPIVRPQVRRLLGAKPSQVGEEKKNRKA